MSFCLFFFNSMQPTEMVKLTSVEYEKLPTKLQNFLNIMKKVSREDRWRGRQAETNFQSDRIYFILPTEIENRDERVTALIS